MILNKLFYNDYNPRHFHVFYVEFKAVININSEIVEGFMPKRALKLVVEWMDLHKIEIEFSTNKKGVVNLELHLDKKIFLPLKDKSFFENFKLNCWTIEWENGADFSPEFLEKIL